MTNSYNLSKRPKIVFIHGLNNNSNVFSHLIEHFEDLGFECEFIILPGHGNDREEISNLAMSLESFNQSMSHLKESPYYVVAFSHGALYFELWMNKYKSHAPLKKIFLAPALYVRHYKILQVIFRLLPSSFKIKSISPVNLRRYDFLTTGEYQILLDGIRMYQNNSRDLMTPCLTLIDPKDELVDPFKLKQHLNNVVYIHRPKLSKGLGQHHILFHPDYFTKEEWNDFTRKIETFLEINAEA